MNGKKSSASKLLSILLISVGASSPAWAAKPKPSPKTKAPAKKSVAAIALPELLKEVESKYTKAGTLTADFTQENETVALGRKKKSSGQILVKRPSKMRWETKNPEPNLLVSDGTHFWFYTPPFDEGEHGQVIERKTSQVQSRLANALLSGSFSTAAKDMKSIVKKGESEFVLEPKRGSAGTVVKATIDVDPAEKIIRKVTLVHKDGNRSEITLSKIELGKPIADDQFVFKAPPDTDKVEE